MTEAVEGMNPLERLQIRLQQLREDPESLTYGEDPVDPQAEQQAGN